MVRKNSLLSAGRKMKCLTSRKFSLNTIYIMRLIVALGAGIGHPRHRLPCQLTCHLTPSSPRRHRVDCPRVPFTFPGAALRRLRLLQTMQGLVQTLCTSSLLGFVGRGRVEAETARLTLADTAAD